MKKLILIAAILILFVFGTSFTAAQTPSPTPTPSSSRAQELQNQIRDLESKISNLQSQEKTLSSQIAVMDNQVKLTILRINATKQQIADLTLDIDTASKKINNIDKSLNNLTKVLVNRIQATYKIGSAPSFQILMASNDVSDFFERANYLRIAQAHDRRLIYDTVQAKNDYANQKEIFEDKKAAVEALSRELQGYTDQLNKEKADKDALLQITQNDEKKYQQLLVQAKAEYEAIVGIIAGKGTESEIRPVNQGDIIASLVQGASCNSSGTHLHFTVSRDGAAQNPFNFLKGGIAYDNRSGGDSFNPSGSWEWPIDPPIEFNQGYGSDTWYVRTYHFYPTHNGIDVSGSSSVKAVKSGTLFKGSYAGYQGCILPYVRVHHNDDGLDTFYLHVY